MVIDRYNDNGDALQLYLREIGKTPLLTREEENELAAQVSAATSAPRTDDQGHLRLVVKISHDYANFGMPLLDLINEGNIGLMKAVERFNPGKAPSFPRTPLCGSSNRFAVPSRTSRKPFGCPSTS